MSNTDSMPAPSPVVLRVDDLSVHYGGGHEPVLKAVDHVSFDVVRGEVVGVVGESGCGKSTLARTVIGLQRPTSGQILLDGEALATRRSRAQARRLQMVFQDPSSALNPRRSIGSVLDELLRVHQLRDSGRARQQRCEELLDMVGLPADMLSMRPSRLSGGQRQRVGIARALAVEPDLLIADEAVAALDVSVRATVLNVLLHAQRTLGLSMIFIGHDLSVVRNVCDRVLVMSNGVIVEAAETETLFTSPRHAYTRALLEAAPRLRPTQDTPLLDIKEA